MDVYKTQSGAREADVFQNAEEMSGRSWRSREAQRKDEGSLSLSSLACARFAL